MDIFNKLKNLNKIFFIKENLYLFVLIPIIFFLDRYTKLEAINNLSENKLYFNKFLNLDLLWNTGIGFGLFKSNSTLVYNSISSLIAVVILLLLYVALKSKILDKIIFSMIIGGALGNFYDRITFNAVPDFIDLHYENFHWFTFNIADIFITLGIILLITKDLFTIKNEKI